ncbi:hypothetical protein [Hydrogenophaga crassostreae]|uniref:hypothetical protein n=1 Tax=Hydrogenophaga crassostreae TaxID=1763535 RepID=UPI0012FA0B69|nr:hypothetical protein [Hydrogenophaga crassostreae]
MNATVQIHHFYLASLSAQRLFRTFGGSAALGECFVQPLMGLSSPGPFSRVACACSIR